MEKSTSQRLQEARALIAQGWTRGQLVRRGAGGRHRYCALGALLQVDALSDGPEQQLLEQCAGKPLVLFNDNHTKSQVLALFDRALVEVAK